jgi:excisionase family DNA binding protein
MDTITTPALHKLSTVSERTNLGRTTLYDLITNGHLKVVRVGRAVRVKEVDLAEFINSMPHSQISSKTDQA